MEKSKYEELAKALSELPDDEDTRRRALLLKEFLVADEHSKTQIADIENGVFRDTLGADEATLAERLLEQIKREFEIDSQKDLMDLWLMIALFVKTRRFMRIESKDTDSANKISSIVKKFLDAYGSLGRELGLTRQQRLVRRSVQYDDTGSLTEVFAGIEQVEMDTPIKKKAKKRRKKKNDEIEVVA